MATMTGHAEYKLYANLYGHSLTDLYMTVEVEYDVEIGWDPMSRKPTLEKATPSQVTVHAGGQMFDPVSWRELAPGLREFIQAQAVTSLEEVEITEEEARDALSEEQDVEEFYRSHRAGVR